MNTDEEDNAFWQEAVKGVRRVDFDLTSAVEKKTPRIVIKERPQYAVKQEFSSYSKNLEETAPGGIDKATLRRFKREEFPVEAVLDLHGLNEAQAFEKVDDFIPRNYNQGKRCVIIITGKGLSAPKDDDFYAERGVLKQRVPQWLNMVRLRAMILVYKHPSERLGGAGALYILLRRKKDF